MSTVAKKVMMGSGAVAEAYEIDQSLIFERSSSAYLHRTPSSTSNQRTFTISTWVKRAGPQNATNDYDAIFGNYKNVTQSDATHSELVFYQDHLQVLLWDTAVLSTNRLFRDPSAWYHIVLAVDTTSGTADNRVRLYVNGVEETSFATRNNPDQNFQFANNLSGTQQMVGNASGSGTNNMYDGQIAEFHHIDGTALTPSSFGETNSDTGQWIPKKYGGSYGTNGFYLKFVSGAIGTDSSGEGNNYTAANLANADVVTDSPTNNCMTLNPFAKSSAQPLTEGNLFAGSVSSETYASATYYPTGGKFYYEYKLVQYSASGIAVAYFKHHSGSYIWNDVNGSSYKIYGSEGNTTISNNWTSGNIIQIAVDETAGKLWYGRNNTWYTVNGTPNPATGSGPSHTFTTPSTSAPYIDIRTGGSQVQIEANYGQRDFSYTPPSGFVAPTAANLPEPAIPLPSAHFNTVVWTGNSTDNRVIPVGFAADFTWFKQRTGTNSNGLFDRVRGNSNPNGLSSNTTSQEFDWTGIFKGHTSTGFTVGTDSAVNANSNTYVAWNWKANGSGSTDTSGDIDAVVSANQAAGFSIMTYTSNGSNAGTIPHGLGVAPELWIQKQRNGAGAWATSTTVIDGSNDGGSLNTTDAFGNVAAIYGTSSSQFISNYGFSNGRTMLAYCFASKENFSKIGVFTGNGSVDGPFVNTGFRPAWVMYKKAAGSNYTNLGRWTIEDNKRDPFNEVTHGLAANTSGVDSGGSGGYWDMDFLSNGFKIRTTEHEANDNGATFIYMAFAESPFKTANAR